MRIAVVTPWYGRELIGGAERLAWELSHALVRAGTQVDVLTTCCRSFLDDWASNYHRSGDRRLESGILLRRFRVDGRDRVAFTRANTALTTVPQIALRPDRDPLDPALTRAFVAENIHSRGLLQHLRECGTVYDAVLFVPYLYGTTIAGLPLVAERAFLIPCLHDEAYAYVEPIRSVVAAARGLLFNSIGEEDTAAAIYGPGVLGKSRVIGHAVDPVVPPAAPAAIGGFVPHRARYVLYLGRQDQSKNLDFLIAAFKLFRERRVATSLQLVLAGPRSASHRDDGITDLGPVDERAKAALLTYARALAQPSLNESFSRSVYESWYARRPVLVHGSCRATARAVEESGGGWIGTTVEDWARLFATIDESADDAVDAYGERGWAAALENGTWDVVARRTLDAIRERFAAHDGPPFAHAVPLGDRGVARYAEALSDALREAGYASEVTIAESLGTVPAARTIVHATRAEGLPAGAGTVVHDGEATVPRRSPVFAATHAIAARLDERGIPARVVPQPVAPGVWSGVRPSHDRWLDGRDVLLSIAPLTAGDARRLLDVFVAYLGLARDARLLVFAADCDDGALATLTRERDELDLQREVVLVSSDRPERYAAYRSATVALAFGHGITVDAAVTPLWFDIPAVALADPIAGETIEACGLVVDEFDAQRIAALVRIVATDAALRAAMTAEGRRVRARHAPLAVAHALVDHLPGGVASPDAVDIEL
jgi:glycosyltransferase involved in cell wall biosynthesis